MDVAALVAELAARDAQNARQAKMIESLLGQLAKLNDRLAELTAALERKKRKPAAPKPVTPATMTEAQRKAFEERPLPPEKPVISKVPKPRPKPTGRKALPKHIAAEEHTFRPTACKHCGATVLDAADTLVEEKLHVVKEHQRRRAVTRVTCRCRACGKRTTPDSLAAPFPRSKVTGAWLAWLIHQKFWMLVPLDRIRRDLASRGIVMPMSTLVSYIMRVADLLDPVDGLHWKQLLAGRWMATDATGLKVLVKGLPEAHNGYLEGDALLAKRRERIGPLATAFDAWRAATLPGLLPSEPLAVAIRYYDNHRAALSRFLEDPLVPIDNSATEREFQNVAKLRLNMLFAGSTEGAHRACVLLGIAATCRNVGVNFEAYLDWAFERLGTHRHRYALPIDKLTPAAFKQTLLA